MCIFGDAVGGVEVGAAVLDAEATAGVEVLDVDAVGAEVFDERAHALDGLGEGRRVADLRADVHADAGGRDAGELRGAAIDFAGPLDGNTELVLAQAGGDVRVSLGEDVWVYAQCDARGLYVPIG